MKRGPETTDLAAARQAQLSRLAKDRHLIERFLNGDTEAFDQLVELGKHDAFARAYWLTGNREDAFDVVQEAYLKLLKALSHWDYSCSVSTWLHRVVTNRCIDLHRRRRTRMRVEEEDVAEAAGQAQSGQTPDPLRLLVSSEQMSELHECVRLLPPRMRRCVHLRFLEGKSILEIAELQKCAVGTVKATIHQGLRKLRAALLGVVNLADARRNSV